MSKKDLLKAAVVIVIAILFWSSFFLQKAFDNATSFIEEIIIGRQIAGAALFILLAALSAMLSPFSSIPLVPFAIVIWGEITTFLFLWGSWALGGVISYVIGRYAAYPIFKHFTPFGKIEYYRKKIPEGFEFIFILLFRLALPSEIPGYVLGVLRYHFWKYFLATLLAELPFGIIAIYASNAFVYKRPGLFASLVILSLLIVVVMFYFLHKNLKK